MTARGAVGRQKEQGCPAVKIKGGDENNVAAQQGAEQPPPTLKIKLQPHAQCPEGALFQHIIH